MNTSTYQAAVQAMRTPMQEQPALKLGYAIDVHALQQQLQRQWLAQDGSIGALVARCRELVATER